MSELQQIEADNKHIYWDAYPQYDDHDKLSCHIFHLTECWDLEINERGVDGIKKLLLEMVEEYGS
jgi:hypothetical protein